MSAPAPGRDYLVFFRSGPNSLHPRLLAEDPQRNWDCAVSYWASAQPPDTLAELYCTGGGNKFDGFIEFWNSEPRSRGYRYYLLLDDDVYFEPGDISRFLSICDRHEIELDFINNRQTKKVAFDGAIVDGKKQDMLSGALAVFLMQLE